MVFDPRTERFMHAEPFFKRIIEDFDDVRGSHHNYEDLLKICTYFRQKQTLLDNSERWIADMVLFDTLIGNTDGFGFIPNLFDAPIPFDYLADVVGVHHNISNDVFD
ncbi:MAG: hypothetical protein OCD01_05260 [Fibrobacterales bacterium]